MEPPPRPKCKQCERYVEYLLTGLKEEVEENETLTEQISQLKQKNSEEKKKHSDINNQIIMSNVRYQQALQQAHAAVQRYNREREEFMRKEVVAASLQGELDAVRKVNKQLMAILQQNSEDLSAPKPAKPASTSQPRVDATKPDQKSKPPVSKGLHLRTASEANSTTYLSVASKMLKEKPDLPPPTSKSTAKTKEAPKPRLESPIRVFEDPPLDTSLDSNMSIDYGSDDDHKNNASVAKPSDRTDLKDTTTHTSTSASKDKEEIEQPKRKVKFVGTENNKENTIDTEDINGRGKYQFRRTIAKGSYAEPSLRVKMRRGDSHPNIIPEYVVRPCLFSPPPK